ncbi:hypothetical protein Pmani_030409 [Petrolisthes manimaculis]|uniref:ATP synthase subunit d, mitochondrial n=1 Tax=Petrolisthes manimaculis TaxID=1843537 RepID=A0AAE1NXC6_9EUCA|nr:hypothetical protein Pmani_030409 [Petrolisthes manimaculis]
MASKRVAASAVDWAALAARVPQSQKGMFNAFKGKSDAYLRRVLTAPENLPKIDFNAYKARIAVPGMVEEFQKKYEAIEVPYPADTYSAQITEVQNASAVETQEFIKGSEARIVKIKEDLAQWENMIPFEQMTMEEFAEQFPSETIDLDNPTFWPHTPEMALDYVEKEEE